MQATMQKRDNSATPARVERTPTRPMFTPNVDILENAEELTLVADMPGVNPDSVDIQYERGELTIRGRVAPRNEQHAFLLNEYGVGDFYRVFQLGEGVDNARISAEIAHGVLTVHLPKVERIKPRKIEVQGA
jgi:HSP20 family protein